MLSHVVKPLATNDQNKPLFQYYIDILACAERYRILGIAIVAPLKFTIEFRHSWYLETFEAYFRVQTASKNEAIQKHLLICQIAMSRTLNSFIRFKIVRLLLLHWRPLAIVEEVHCHSDIVYNIQENLFIYHSSCKPQFRLKSVLRKIFSVAEDSLITYLKQQSWIMQKEMMWFLWKKWDIHVHRFTIFRILKKRHWSEKREQRVDIKQNNELRLNWIVDLLQLTAEQLVFIDETLFNETTRWHQQVYASIDESARYQVSRKREHFWSFFQHIQSMTIYSVSIFVKADSMTKPWLCEQRLLWLCQKIYSI